MKPAASTPSAAGWLGWRRIVRALGYSWQGLTQAWRDEQAFRQEVGLGTLALLLSCLVSLSWIERAVLLGATLLVLLVELLNSAIEAAIDRVSSEPHALSKKAKDIGSAAVLLALMLWLLCWGTVLLPRWLPQWF